MNYPREVISTVVTAASSLGLTTRARAKAMLSLTSNDDDAYLDILIPQITASISQYCNRVFALQTYQDLIKAKRPPRGMNWSLQLAHGPLVSVVSVTETTDGIDTVLVAGTDYDIDAKTSELFRLNSDGLTADWAAPKTVVIYQAGWTLPGQSGQNALIDSAADVEDIAVRMIKARRDARSRDPFLKSEETAGIGRSEYWVPSGPSGNMTPDMTDVLDNYREIPL
jgi:hypothetical protein